MTGYRVLGVLKRTQRQALRFLRAVLWLAGFAHHRAGLRFYVPIVAGPLGLVLLGAGIAGVFATVTALEGGGGLRLRGVDLGEVRSGTLPLVVTAMALLVAGGSWVLYRGRTTAIQIAAESQMWLAQSLLATPHGVLPHPSDYRDARHIARAVERLVRTEPARVALALRRTLEFPGAVSAVAGGATVLLVLDPVATAIGALFTLLALPFFYLVNIRAMHATKRTEALAAEHSKAIAALYRRLAPLPQSTPSSTHAAVASEPSLRALADAWRIRFQSVDSAQFISQALAAAVFFALLLYFGGRMLAGEEGLSTIALFVLVLQFTLVNIRTLARLSATIARYYPSIYRVQHFLTPPSARRPGELLPSWRWRPRPNTPGSRSATVRVEPGSAIGISCEVVPHRFSSGFYLRLLQRGWGRHPRTPHLIAVTPLDPDRWPELAQEARLELAFRDAMRAQPDALIGIPAVHTYWANEDPQVRPLLLIWSKGRPPKATPASLQLVFATTGELVAHGPPDAIRKAWGEIAELLAATEVAPKAGAGAADDEID